MIFFLLFDVTYPSFDFIMKKTWFILSCLVIFYAKTYSQTDFRPGYIINLNNDTTYGLIDSRGDIRNAQLCVFRKDTKSEPINYTPADLFGYRFIDGKYYISKTVVRKKQQKEYFWNICCMGKLMSFTQGI